jgi:hypothetical protein
MSWPAVAEAASQLWQETCTKLHPGAPGLMAERKGRQNPLLLKPPDSNSLSSIFALLPPAAPSFLAAPAHDSAAAGAGGPINLCYQSTS